MVEDTTAVNMHARTSP